MREMKNTGVIWCPTIPNSWNLEKVKHNFYISKVKASTSNPIVLKLARTGVQVRDISNNEGQLAASYDDYNPVRYGDLLLNPMDLYSGANCNMSEIEGVISPAYANLRKLKELNPKYYDYYFKLQYWTMAMFAHGKGVSFDNRWTINAEGILNYEIPVPTKEEQDLIVKTVGSKCEQVDTLIANQEAQIEKLKLYKQSLITEVVTRGLNPDAEMKDSGVEWIGEIPTRWNVKPLLREIDEIVDYRGKTPEKVDEGVLLVTARNIKDGKIDYSISREYVKPDEYAEIMHRGQLKVGDVLFTTEAPLGAVANVDRTDFALAQRIIKFTTKESLDSYYLKYWMLSSIFQQHLKSYATGSTATGIKASKLCLLVLVCPTVLEQKQIVKFLDEQCSKIDKLIELKQSKIAKLNEYKKSLIYEYVTGKKEVV